MVERKGRLGAGQDAEYVRRHTIGRPHADRARQFMPFAALKGFYDLVHEQERVREPKRALTEEEARELDERLGVLGRGQVVTVVHYDKDAYVKTTGAVSQVDVIFRDLWIVRTRIPFDDILSIEVAGGEGRSPTAP